MVQPSRILTALLALCALLAAASAETIKKSSSSKKEGGFTKATPKPESTEIEKPFTTPIPALRKKSSTSGEATPRPKKKSTHEPENAESKKEEKAAESETPAPTPKKKESTKEGETKEKTEAKTSEKKESEKKESTASTPAKTYDNEGTGDAVAKTRAPAATIEPDQLVEYAAQPVRVQTVISAALELTKLNLTYAYGSAEPSRGGMDCSGTMYYLLRSQGFKDVPRDSSGQYVWARKQGQFFAVVSKSADSFEFKDLQPGDLMFWSGTYTVERDVPITHVMMYLGTEKKTKKRVMFGSSDGRSYNGVQRWGVSVFDFKMPKADPANPEKAKVDFVGYARIPSLRDGSMLAGPATVEPLETQAKAEGAVPEKPASNEDSPEAGTPKKLTATPSKRKSSSKSATATPRPKKKSSQ